MFQSFPVLQFPQRFADQVEGGDDVGGEGATVNLRPVTGGRRAEGLSFGRELRGHRAPGHGRLSRSQAPLCVAFQILFCGNTHKHTESRILEMYQIEQTFAWK